MTRIKRNTGRSLEAQVELAGQWYRQHGIGWLERVEPSQRWVNGKPVIIKPALADFLGVYWIGNHEGRVPVAIECKSMAGVHSPLTLAKVLPRINQRQRLSIASDIWQVTIVVETDIGNGVGYYRADVNPYDFAAGTIQIKPCAWLPNGAPDILGLRIQKENA